MTEGFYVCSWGVVNCPQCRPLFVAGDVGRIRTLPYGDQLEVACDFDDLIGTLVAAYGADAISLTSDARALDPEHAKQLEAARRAAAPPAEDVMTQAAAEREADAVLAALRCHAHGRPPQAYLEPAATPLLDELVGAC